jgi:hypothetical protein
MLLSPRPRSLAPARALASVCALAPAHACVRLALLLVLGLGAQAAAAQSSGNGTVYSRFGVGELNTFASSQSEAMGGGATALRSLNYATLSNPALLSDQVLTRLAVSGRYEQVFARNAQDETSRLASGTLEAVQLSFPLLARRLGVALSFKPFARTDYRSEAAGRLTSTVDTTDYRVVFEGQGGLQELSAGTGYRVSDALSLGASVEVLFGILEDRRLTTFTNDSFIDTDVADALRLVGVTGTLGGHYTLDDVLGDGVLALGASLRLPTRLTGDVTRTEGENLDADTLAVASGGLDLPWRARLGAAFQPDDRWTLVADATYAPWSTASSSFDGAGGTSPCPVGGDGTLRDAWRLSTGAEWLPAGEDFSRGYLARTAYRLGVAVEQLYVSPVAGRTLYGYTVTGGVSLPTSVFGTRLDLNVQAGQRGTTADNLVRDTFYGISLNLNIGERWFQERRLR